MLLKDSRPRAMLREPLPAWDRRRTGRAGRCGHARHPCVAVQLLTQAIESAIISGLPDSFDRWQPASDRFLQPQVPLVKQNQLRISIVANIKSAKKRAKQTVVRNARNVAQRSMLRTAVKKVIKALDANDAAGAEAAFASAQPILDRFSCARPDPQEQGCPSQEPPDRAHQGPRRPPDRAPASAGCSRADTRSPAPAGFFVASTKSGSRTLPRASGMRCDAARGEYRKPGVSRVFRASRDRLRHRLPAS